MAPAFIIIIALIFYFFVFPDMYARWKNRMKYGRSPGLSGYELNEDVSNAQYLADIVNTLKTQFPWYQKLTTAEKYEFANRTYYIRKSKTFHGMENFVLEDKHEIILSATLAQLTFGLKKNFELPSFELIHIYPSTFHSKLLEQEVKGLTLGNGRIFISWQHFEEGHEDDDDKIHVGLHEFAHAMMIEYQHFQYVSPWKKWSYIGERMMAEIRTRETHFFRKYGATNIHEMWAVTVESFFEQPQEFRIQHPDFYYATVAMLNQDPCARMEILETI
jgi:Mlc titration factor MtfA (ptsG expression regulator)